METIRSGREKIVVQTNSTGTLLRKLIEVYKFSAGIKIVPITSGGSKEFNSLEKEEVFIGCVIIWNFELLCLLNLLNNTSLEMQQNLILNY